VTGTAGRLVELDRLGASLRAQALRDFEWILVDQNADDRLSPFCARWDGPGDLRRIRQTPGLSAALNRGVREARAELVGFPDDDGWFAPEILERVVGLFRTHGDWQGIACRAVDENGRPSIIRWSPRPGACTRLNSWFRAVSTGLFFRRSVFDRIGGFDETLGVGPGVALASHDTDFVLRAVRAGLRVEYLMDPAVGHPQVVSGTDEESVRKLRNYAVGAGRLMRDHDMPWWWVGAAVALPTARAVIDRAHDRNAARVHWAEATGRIAGWLGDGGGRKTWLSAIAGSSTSRTGSR
jgi:GT2 family glycosyltransferase